MYSDAEYILRCGEIGCSLNDKDSYLSFTSVDHATIWGNSHYGDWADEYVSKTRLASKLSNGSFSLIERYCGWSYREINGCLRELYWGVSKSLAQEMAHILTLCLCDAPRIPENIIVFRMVCDTFANRLFYDNKHDLATYEKGFMSTSLLDTIAINREHSHHHHLLKIYVPKGTVGVYVNPVTSRTEQEILIAPNRRLAMIDYPHKGEHGKYVTECMLINME